MALTNLLGSLGTDVIIVTGGIFIFSILAWIYTDPSLSSTISELRKLRSHFNGSEPSGKSSLQVAAALTEDANILAILRETESGLFSLPGDMGLKTYSLRFYQDIWTPKALLAKRVNLALYEAMPNILIGVGLLFTFVFLALALAEVTPAIQNSDPDAIKSAISGLLKNASGKFMTSISGMFCSLLWTWFSKKHLEELDDEIEQLCVAMQRHVEDTGSEAAISAQIDVLNMILEEGREQVGQLKRFETDFAVAIGEALGNRMQPAFEQLTLSITAALNALTEKVGSMNEDALEKMLTDFQDAIREHSGKEMESFKQTLVDIAEHIKDAADKLEGASGSAGRAIREGGQVFGDALAGGAGDLRQAASLLDQAMITAKATVNDMDETIERASTQGRQGLENLQAVLSRLAVTATEVGSLVTKIQAASDGFEEAAAATADATENLQKVVDEQNTLVSTVSTAAKDLGASLVTANQEFRKSAETMSQTTKDMTAGVENYSEQLAELHGNLDQSLAKAIGSLNSTISELVDGLDDFLEEIGKGRS